MTSTSSIEELPLAECRQLLNDNGVSRLGVVVHGKPFIFPVNYGFDADMVVFRTDPGTKLAGAGFGPVVFEIDGLDPDGRGAWSVIVSGMSSEITGDPDELAQRLQNMPVQPWPAGEHAHWVAVRADSITGRRITRM